MLTGWRADLDHLLREIKRLGRLVGSGFMSDEPSEEGTPPPIPQAPGPPGLQLAFDTAADKLKAQLAQIDQLDTKAGVLVAALGAAVAVFLANSFSPIARAIIGVLLGGSIYLATRAFLVGKYMDAPDPEAFSKYAGYDPAVMRQLFLPNLLSALQTNQLKVSRKGIFLNQALALVGILAELLIVGKVFELS